MGFCFNYGVAPDPLILAGQDWYRVAVWDGVDWTGVAITGEIRDRFGTTTRAPLIITGTDPSLPVTPPGADGVIWVGQTTDGSAALGAGCYSFEIWAEYSDGIIEWLHRGQLVITRRYSK